MSIIHFIQKASHFSISKVSYLGSFPDNFKRTKYKNYIPFNTKLPFMTIRYGYMSFVADLFKNTNFTKGNSVKIK